MRGLSPLLCGIGCNAPRLDESLVQGLPVADSAMHRGLVVTFLLLRNISTALNGGV